MIFEQFVSTKYFQCTFENGIFNNGDMCYDLSLFYLHHKNSQYLLSPCYNNTAKELKMFLKQRNFKTTIKLTEKSQRIKLALKQFLTLNSPTWIHQQVYKRIIIYTMKVIFCLCKSSAHLRIFKGCFFFLHSLMHVCVQQSQRTHSSHFRSIISQHSLHTWSDRKAAIVTLEQLPQQK